MDDKGSLAKDYGYRVLYWANSVRKRCNVPTDTSFKYYGAKGVKFKFADLREFAEYMLTMGRVQGIGKNLDDILDMKYSVDRIDVYGDYQKGNLRWATRTEQANNKRANANAAPLIHYDVLLANDYY